LDDWIYCTLHIHSVRDYSATAILYTFQLTVAYALSQPSLVVSWQRISTQYLYQSHCNCSTHDVFLTPPNSFLAIILQLPIPKTRPNSLPTTVLYSLLLCFYYCYCQSQSHIATDGQSVSLGIKPHLGPMTRYLFPSGSYVLVSVGRPL
jgi:hypothetical protein